MTKELENFCNINRQSVVGAEEEVKYIIRNRLMMSGMSTEIKKRGKFIYAEIVWQGFKDTGMIRLPWAIGLINNENS